MESHSIRRSLGSAAALLSAPALYHTALYTTALCTLALAQERRDAERIRTLLGSTSPTVVATAAASVKALDWKELDADLCAALQKWGAKNSDIRDAVGLTLMDSLIRRGGRAPTGVLLPWLHDVTLNPAIVLMAREPERHIDELLHVFRARRERHTFAWLATGNLLASTKSRKFVEELLEGLAVELHVELMEPGEGRPAHRYLWAAQRIFIPHQVIARPPEFPIYGFHRLDTRRCPDATELAPGPRPVYWHREVSDGGDYALRQNWPLPYFQDCELEWLAEILDVRARSLPLQRINQSQITWKDRRHFARKISNARREVAGRCEALVHRLKSVGLLRKSWRPESPATIRVTIYDRRKMQRNRIEPRNGWVVKDERRYASRAGEDEGLLNDLGSESTFRIARAARAVTKTRPAEPAKALRATLRRLHAFGAEDAAAPRLALLEAMIRIGEDATPEDLDFPIDEHVMAATLILAAKDPRRFSSTLLAILNHPIRGGTYLAWVAAGNLLSQVKSRALLKHCLSHLRATVEVHVVAAGGESKAGDLNVDQRTFLARAKARQAALRGDYRLTDSGRRGEREIATGLVDIHLRPEPVQTAPGRRGMVFGDSQDRFVNLTEQRLAWIAATLQMDREKLPFKKYHRLVIVWRGAADYRAKIEGLRRRIREDRKKLADRLRTAQLLVVAPARESTVQIVVKDHRGKDAAKLPVLRGVQMTR